MKNKNKVRSLTVAAISLDVAALILLAWTFTQGFSWVLWTFLAVLACVFVIDIKNAVKFYRNFSKNN